MKKPFDGDLDHRAQHDLIIGLGERSLRKSYFPQLQDQLSKLERFRLLLDETSDIILMAELPSGKIVDNNRTALKAIGIREMQSLRLQDLFPAEDLQDDFRSFIADDKDTSSSKLQLETCFNSGTDREMPVELILRKSKLEDRDYVVLVGRDISERREAEEIRRRLEQRISHSQRLDSLGMLAGGIAHDFNNLLMAVIGNLSLLEMELPGQSPLHGHIKEIVFATNSARDLTSRLLGLAKGGKYETSPACMNDIISNTCNMFSRTHKNLTVETNLAADLRTVEVDRSQMEQVLINLFVNADHAMADHGKLGISSSNLILEHDDAKLLNLKAGSYILVEVSDNGCGMDKATCKKVFDPFFSTRIEGRGTGLGLASVYGIISNHEGLISVYSELDLGTTFRIYLPTTDREPLTKSTPSGGMAKGKGLILVVDDEEIILTVTMKMLEKLGYEVLGASNGKEAIEIYEQHPEIELVILDMIMPGMGGEETFHILRELNRNMKVLLSSGYSMNEQTKRILDQGFSGFLNKPFNTSDLATIVKDTLS
ncbi:MAG: response regulator [bacterium]|nr:response regulator [bacterium]